MQANQTYATGQTGIEGITSSYFDKKTEKPGDLTYKILNEVDQTIEPPFSNISYSFASGLTDLVYDAAGEEGFPSRRQALDYFDKEFMKRELKRVKGNITQYVRNAFGTEDERKINSLRKTAYRKIGKHKLTDIVDGIRPWKAQQLEECYSTPKIDTGKVQYSLTSSLQEYKGKLSSTTYRDISKSIEENSAVLADKISQYVPTQESRLSRIMGNTDGMMRYDQAKQTFEREVIYDALSAAKFDKTKAARYLGDSLRTLNRRIEQLGMDVDAMQKEKEQANAKGKTIDMLEHIMKKEGNVSVQEEISVEERQQMVQEYNARREAARKAKERMDRVSKGQELMRFPVPN